MTYDQWKTTDLRDYAHEEEEQPAETELDLAYDRIMELQDAAKISARAQAARIAELEASLLECLEYFKDKYDVNDGDYGEPSPNKEMSLGQMIDETLYGIRF